MKLEAVNPVDPEEVCIATVTKLKDSYLWLQLEGKPDQEEECSTQIMLWYHHLYLEQAHYLLNIGSKSLFHQ